MQANATQRNTSSHGKVRLPQYKKVLDGRKQPIRGLWQSMASGKFYAQLAFESASGQKMTRRGLLAHKDERPVATVAQARDTLERLKDKRDDNDLPILSRTQRFADFTATYLDFIHSGQGMKEPETIVNEKGAIKKWNEHVGGLR